MTRSNDESQLTIEIVRRVQRHLIRCMLWDGILLAAAIGLLAGLFFGGAALAFLPSASAAKSIVEWMMIGWATLCLVGFFGGIAVRFALAFVVRPREWSCFVKAAKHPERIDWLALLAEPVLPGEHLADHIVEHTGNSELRLRQTSAGRLYVFVHRHMEFVGVFAWNFVVALLLGIGGVTLSLPAWAALALALAGGGVAFASTSLWPVIVTFGDGGRSPLLVRTSGSALSRRIRTIQEPASARLEICEETGALVVRDDNDRIPILSQLHGGADGLAGMLATRIAVARCAAAMRSLAPWQGADELMQLDSAPGSVPVDEAAAV